MSGAVFCCSLKRQKLAILPSVIIVIKQVAFELRTSDEQENRCKAAVLFAGFCVLFSDVSVLEKRTTVPFL